MVEKSAFEDQCREY